MLEIGDEKRVIVNSRAKFNDSGVDLVAGSVYRIASVPGARWKDLHLSRDANGWKSEDIKFFSRFVRSLEKNRRLPSAHWFEMVGAYGKSDRNLFRIGTQVMFQAAENSRLFLFANDLPSMYWNNSGSIETIVTRIE